MKSKANTIISLQGSSNSCKKQLIFDLFFKELRDEKNVNFPKYSFIRTNTNDNKKNNGDK